MIQWKLEENNTKSNRNPALDKKVFKINTNKLKKNIYMTKILKISKKHEANFLRKAQSNCLSDWNQENPLFTLVI